MNFITRYMEAFKRCYPAKEVSVRSSYDRQMGVLRYRVIIDNDPGERTYTEYELISATADFNRGQFAK